MHHGTLWWKDKNNRINLFKHLWKVAMHLLYNFWG